MLFRLSGSVGVGSLLCHGHRGAGGYGCGGMGLSGGPAPAVSGGGVSLCRGAERPGVLDGWERSARGFWVDGSEAPRVLGSNGCAGYGGWGLGMRRCWGVGVLVRLWGRGVGMRGVEMPGRRCVRRYGMSGGLECRSGETRWCWCPGTCGLLGMGHCMSGRAGLGRSGLSGSGVHGGLGAVAPWRVVVRACGGIGLGARRVVGLGVLLGLGRVSVPCSHAWVLSGPGSVRSGFHYPRVWGDGSGRGGFAF